MNRLKLTHVTDSRGRPRLQYWIDGQPFEHIFYLLRSAEDKEAEECGPNYLSHQIYPRWLLRGFSSDIPDVELRIDSLQDKGWFEAEFLDSGDPYGAHLLECHCGGDAGCWSVWCSVEIQGQSVKWKDFKSAGGSSPAKPLDLEFEFDRGEYLSELLRLFTSESASGNDWSRQGAGTERVVAACFSERGDCFITTTRDAGDDLCYHTWNLHDGLYGRCGSLGTIDGDETLADRGADAAVKGGPIDPEELWSAEHEPGEPTVRIVSKRTAQLLVELRFDAASRRWLVLAMDGLFDIQGRLKYPVRLPTALDPYIRDRNPQDHRKGLLALALTFDRYQRSQGDRKVN